MWVFLNFRGKHFQISKWTFHTYFPPTPTLLGIGDVCRPVEVHWKNNRSIIIHHWSHMFPWQVQPIGVLEIHYGMCPPRQGKEEKVVKLFFELFPTIKIGNLQ